jgi:adenylate cyclase
VAIDFESEGLLEGIGDERARAARLELLRDLEQEGFSLDELRRATRENRLALLPMEHVLAPRETRYTQLDLAELTGLDVDFLAEARRAIGAPAIRPDERVLGEEDLELTRSAAALLAAGISREAFLDLIRVMSQAMGTVAAVFMSIFGEALLRPGDNERDLGLRYADTLRNLGPLAAPTLGQMLNLRLRERLNSAMVGEAELRSGRLLGSTHVTVGFVDIVGFTRLGEQVPPEELGALVRSFEASVESAVRPPARLVKTIGDAALVVSPAPAPVLDAVLCLVEKSRAAEADGRPLLRGGVASGEAIQRAGDWYGRPVNLAARLTAFARRGSVVASGDVREALPGPYRWSFAGNRRFKGVAEEVPVYRVRPAAEPEGG